jgi:antitoxin component YwqK of YwqJK toxin-antitoxin module
MTKKALYQKWHDNGALWFSCQSTDGHWDGLYQIFREDGTPEEVAIYKKGLRNGQFIQWHNNGRLAEVRNYKNGVLNGDFKSFNEKGEYIGNYEFCDGELIKTFFGDGPDSSLI